MVINLGVIIAKKKSIYIIKVSRKLSKLLDTHFIYTPFSGIHLTLSLLLDAESWQHSESPAFWVLCWEKFKAEVLFFLTTEYVNVVFFTLVFFVGVQV